ncbi:hypothetical protein [Caballeronia mineralivorans]|jgi:hypothetical protein|uniref:hypothetical protein n=1 Tax=Caballeronia mineralivorans TaxID=2010198 RepID=UPI0023F33F52|nr:hypothetical protein [Caballeronia mineralivorans]MDB5789879.1 hypothetical protein [Caballeronia mineralivorans]
MKNAKLNPNNEGSGAISRRDFSFLSCLFTAVFLGAWMSVASGQSVGQPLSPEVTDSAPAATASPINTLAATSANVLTYHGDTNRTGWNSKETTLTPSNVKAGSFGVLYAIPLGDRVNDWVDAQPLVVSALSVKGKTQDVVYVATEANNIYAYSASTGELLIQRNLGTPVPRSRLPGGCDNNGRTVGINSTPVIDPSTTPPTLYVVSFKLVNDTPTYQLHALDSTTLVDTGVSPTTISASRTLSNGTTTYNFAADFSRQRAGLLLANGNIYAAFASFCDIRADQSRGWVLGWKANTLSPLPANQSKNANHLMNKLSTSPNTFYLSSVWMSGYGIAAGPTGVLYFITGNSDAAGTTYGPPNNVQESVVKLSADLTTLVDYFTPSGSNGVGSLDSRDDDFGSGGAMVIPAIPGESVGTVVAGGKRGRLYLINRSSMGHNDSGRALSIADFGSCWCGPSYFMGSDGVRRVVSSGGRSIKVWKVPATPALQLEKSFASIASGQDGGFFTTISSNGTSAGSAIIWAVGRPTSTAAPANVTLYAFNASGGTTPIFSSVAGSWPGPHSNANIVPTVANGKVFVASFAALNIFAPGGTRAPLVVPPPPTPPAPLPSQIYGIVTSVDTLQITIKPQTGVPVLVDTSAAEQAHLSVPLVVGKAVHVFGSFSSGAWHAERILRAKDSPESWVPTN